MFFHQTPPTPWYDNPVIPLMKKGFATIGLLLLFAGCLPLSPSAAVKGGTESVAEVEEFPAGREEDSVATGVTAAPEAGPAKTDPIAPEVANRFAIAEQGPIEPKSELGEANPLTRFAPPPPPTGSGPLAFAKAGPIDPKSEVAEAMPRYCLFDRLLYGPDFSDVIRCDFIPPEVELPAEGTVYDLKLRLEKNLAERKVISKVELKTGPDQWETQAEGFQVRLVYQPAEGGDDCPSLEYVDAVTTAATAPSDRSNLPFSGLERKAGLLRFFLLRNGGRSADFQTERFKRFDAPDGCPWPLGNDDFVFIGYLKMVETQTIFLKPRLDLKLLPAPPESQPTNWSRLRLIKDIDLSEP